MRFITCLSGNVNETTFDKKMTTHVLQSVNLLMNIIYVPNKSALDNSIIDLSLDNKDISNIDEMLCNADKALYEAKREGKNQVKIWSE